MRPHDRHAWADPYGYVPALAPVRKPWPKRSRRERIRSRSMRLARRLKNDRGRRSPDAL